VASTTRVLTTPDGRRLAYERRGAGPRLVCHPGGPGGSAAEFRDLADLSGERELVLLSPRGSCGSDPAADYSLASYAADLDLLREELGAEAIDLLGFSHGGCVAMTYAATYPSRVSRLVLADTIAVFDAEARQAQALGIEARRTEPWFADAERAIAEEQDGAFETVEELRANVRLQIPLYFHRWEGNEATGLELADDFGRAEPLHWFNREELPTLDLRPALAAIEVPTLVITGASDFICGPVCAATIAGALAAAETVVLPDAGHFTYVEQPAAFRRAVGEFLTRR
jgi:pimeloyl-ACP methyl ester carboxylesterase